MECLLESQDQPRGQVRHQKRRYFFKDLGFKWMEILNQKDLLTNQIFMRLLLIILRMIILQILQIKVPQLMILKLCG